MKRILNKRIIFTVVIILFGVQLFAQIPDPVLLSLKTGNTTNLAKYFNQNIELAVLDQDDVYSKAQAQQIVANFFGQYKAKGFSIIHEAGKEDSKYAIGNLVTDKETFRVSFLLKTEGGKSYIHQLRIEKQ